MKDKILQKALEQFQKNGIRDMAIQKLVTQLNISTKTIYKHFSNKEELLEEALRFHYNTQHQYLKNQINTQDIIPVFYNIWYQSVENEFNINNKFFHDLQYYYPALSNKIEVEVGIKFWKLLNPLVSKGVDEGIFLGSINPELVLESISILIYRIGRSDQFQKFNATPQDIFRNSIETIIRGMCTEKGLQELERHIKTIK